MTKPNILFIFTDVPRFDTIGALDNGEFIKVMSNL